MYFRKLLFGLALLLGILPLSGQITVDVGPDVFICEGESITLSSTVTGGDGNYTYAWMPAIGLSCTECPNPTANMGGSYTLTVEDGLGEQGSDAVTIVMNPSPIIDEDATDVEDVDCNGAATGSINLEVSGGTATYTYAWTGPNGFTANTEDIENLETGLYTVIVTDAQGCTDEASFTVEEPTEVVIDTQETIITPPQCNAANGAIDISLTGGTPGYTYQWVGPNGFSANTEDINNLEAGQYTVTATDAEGCSDVDSYTMTEIPSFTITGVVTEPGCDGTGDGGIDLTVTGDTGPYDYQWSTGENTEDIIFSVSGIYTVTVTDDEGCSQEASFQVLGGNPVVNAIVQDVFCNGEATGFIQLNAPDGISYEWNDGFNGPVRQGLVADEYCVTVTSGNGCTTEECYTISEPSPLELSVQGTDETCAGAGDGSLTAIVTGGVAPYTYNWSNGTTTSTLNFLPPGTYTVTVADGNGCIIIGEGTVGSVEPFNVNIGGVPTEPCVTEFTLTAEVVQAGTYTYLWEVNGVVVSTSDELINPEPGVITLIVTNDQGCTEARTLEYDPLPFVSIGTSGTLDCVTGTTVLDGSNSAGGPGFTYTWTGPNGFSSDQTVVTVSEPGEYTLTVENSAIAGCINSGSVTVVDLELEFDPGIITALTGCNAYELTGFIPVTYSTPVAFLWTAPDGTMSTEQTIIPTQTGVYTLATELTGTSCTFYYTTFVDLETEACATISGTVYNDLSELCLFNTDNPTLQGFLITATMDNGQTFNALSADDGTYEISVPASVAGAVSISPPSTSWDPCVDVISINALAEGEVFDASFWVVALVACPELDVTLSASFLRRCFTGVYYITVTNLGTEIAADAEVTLILDDFLSYNNSSLTPVGVVDQTVLWNVGDLVPNESTTFWVRVNVSCDAELGQVHCSEVFATPDPLCVPGQDWGGTNLELRTDCAGDEVIFTVRNTGSSDLSEAVNYIVIEDGVAMMQPQVLNDLPIGMEETFAFPANGSTYTFQIDQVENHPYTQLLSLSVEGCGVNEMGNFSTGFVSQFSQTTSVVAEDILCLENIGAYDPNDKAALPIGYGEQHYIVPETELYYRIRFQNTGTDTAFTVVVRDTLSDAFDMRTLRPGNSSHDYDFSIDGDRALTFTFNNILLPDSTTNLEASQGFLDFRISPEITTPLETVIENSAAIYFDFNEPVITNTVFHTLGRDFLEVVNTVVATGVDIRWNLFPNPVGDQLQMTLDGELPAQMQLQLLDAQGRLLRTQSLAGATHEVSVADLPAGWYQLRLTDQQGKLLGAAKVVKK